MTNPSYDNKTAKKILAARQVTDIPYNDKMVDVPNIAQLLYDRRDAQPDAPYLIYRDGDERVEISYASFTKKVNRTANFMLGTLGIQPGQRVGAVTYNHPDTVVLMFACWLVGATYVPINIGDDDERIEFILNNAEAKAVFGMPDLLERIESLKDNLTAEYFIQINGDPQGSFIYLPDEVKTMADEVENYDALATLDSEALLVYTSGTTGTPKGVILEQYNLLVDIKCISDWYGFNSNDRAMLILPIHHVNGIVVTLLTPLWFGGSTVLNRKFSASNYWRIAAEEHCTFGSVVPTILAFLCEKGEDRTQYNLSARFFLICGAGPLTVELGERFEEQFKIRINHGYGLSETTCYSCYLPYDLTENEHNRWMRDDGYPAIGVPLPCNEMDIQTDSGESVAEGEKGEIVVRGHNVMKGYFLRPEANEDAFKNEWFRTGDEGFYKRDDKGRTFFFITGRLKELIIRGGVNYSPLEIDEAISRIPGVKAGMAVGFENNAYGEEIGAYIQPEANTDLTEEQVLSALKHLPFTKRPKVVVFGQDFPVTATGKYQRNKLKPLFIEWKDTQFRE